jgi:hypothetical protein
MCLGTLPSVNAFQLTKDVSGDPRSPQNACHDTHGVYTVVKNLGTELYNI